MSVRSLNGLGGSTNVYVNTNLSATAPVVVNQTSFTNPIVVSLKGLSGFGTAGQIIKVNSNANSLEYGDNNDYWTLLNNNLYPNSTSDRVVIGTNGSFNTSTALTINNSNPGLSGFYTNGILDINNQANGNQIYLSCNKDQSNDIYFGDANSGVGSTDGVLLRQQTDNSDNNVFKINSVSAGANTNRVNIDMPATNDTFLKVQSSTNAYLELKENDNNRVDLRYDVDGGGTGLDTFKSVFYHTTGNQSIFNYNHSPTLSSRELLFFPITKFEDDVLIKHTGGSGTQSKLIFSNTTNSNTYSFEYSENTNVFNFKKNSAVLWEYADSNSPAIFTINPVFKFGNTIFRNASNQEIELPTSAGKLALLTDITAAAYWALSSNTLKTAQTSYNVVLGKSTASTGNPKLDVLGNSRIDGNETITGSLQVEDHFKVQHTDPFTYVYDPTGNTGGTLWGTGNPYISYHTNGTSFIFNLPVNSGSSSNFRFLTANATELMRMDAGSNFKIFGTTNAKIEIENNGATNSTSTLDFTNSDNGDFYRFEYNYAISAFNFIHNHLGTDEDIIWEYNDSTEEFFINKDTIIRNEENIDAKLFINCNNSTGAEAQLIFGDFDTTSKYTLQYDFHVSTPAFELLDENLNTIFRFTDNDDTFSFNNKIIHTSRFISLTGNSGQITNGSQFFTLPSTSGTLALQSEVGSDVFNTSGTTMTADPQANNTDITTQFKISAGNGSNGDCVLIIEADTNDSVEASNPEILLKADGGNSTGTIKLDNNDLKILTGTNGVNNQSLVLDPLDKLKILANATIEGSFSLLTDSHNINFHNPGSSSNQDDMNKLRFNNDDNCFIAGQYETNDGAVGNDIVMRFTGGDIRMFRGNVPNSRAGNYNALFFIATDNALEQYAGYDQGSGTGTNIKLQPTKFDGNRTYDGGTSDDRLKHNEELITNATDTLMKLRPQIYMKDSDLPKRRGRKNPDIIKDNENISQEKEAGLIAQEVYYEAPELRHLVITRVENEEDIKELPDGVDLNDIQNDPDYVSLGWNEYEPANVKYQGLIPYLIKMNQEQQQQINNLTNIINKLIESPSFKAFKQKLE